MMKKRLIKITESDLHNIIRGCAARLIKENIEEHVFYDYVEEYGPSYVFDEFHKNPKGKQNWSPLINPDMYAKALREFSQYGRFVRFPGKYVYQWMGIIMRNTAILIANTNIAGHGQYFPLEEFEDFLISWYGEDRYIKVKSSQDVTIQLTPEETIKICDEGRLFEAVDKTGQMYFPWYNQEDIDKIDAWKDNREKANNFKKTYSKLFDKIEVYNQRCKGVDRHVEINYENQAFLWHTDVYDFLDCIGLYDWMMMPDGSDAFSDYGLSPLYEAIDKYNDNLSPEEVLVLVNRALDVYHQRGDMSSIFIEGGSRALSKIAESIKKKGLMIKG